MTTTPLRRETAPSADPYRAALERACLRIQLASAVHEHLDDIAGAVRGRLAALVVPTDADAPMQVLAERLGLDGLAVDFLWTVVAATVDGRVTHHLEALGGAPARRGLSVALYAAVAELGPGDAADLALRLVQRNALVGDGLIAAADDTTPAARPYVAAPRLVSYLAGEAPDAAGRVLLPGDLAHDERQRTALQMIARALRAPRALIVIEGPAGSGRSTAAAVAAGRRTMRFDAGRMAPRDPLDGLVALRREVALEAVLPVLTNVEHLALDERADTRRLLGRFLDDFPGPLVATSAIEGVDLGTSRPVVRVRWTVPEAAIRATLWAAAAADAGLVLTGSVDDLSVQYRVGPGAIEKAVQSAQYLRSDGAACTPELLSAGLRHNITERLGGLAERVEVQQSWDDLVLAEDTRAQISGLIARVRQAHRVLHTWGYRSKIARGTGIAALFSGAPGTGKTMVAGLIARELGLDLYQVDLSKIISKWVGETEKQLSQVFDAAEEGHALLLFDEADALFGQRSTEVRGAVDRYANLEVNYLLQRVEAFEGLTILTTNMDTAIDRALKRRLAAHVVFAAPDEDERTALWSRLSHTREAPLAADIDAEELARKFPAMTGANIRNAVLAAAYLAAANGAEEITHDHLVLAARSEYRSMGHVLAEPPRGLR